MSFTIDKDIKAWFRISVALLLLMALAVSCEESGVNSDLGEDLSSPVIRVESVNPGDTLTVDYDYAGTFLDMSFLDETALKEYHVEIIRNEQVMLEITNQAIGTISNYSVDLSDLETNTLYQVEATVTDDADNTTSLLFSIQIFFQDAVVDYDSIFIVGTATSGGYDLSQQSQMAVDPNNPNIFVWSDTLQIGEFKFKTYAEEDFCLGEWIHPTTENPEFSGTEYEILEGCSPDNPDYTWNVEVPGIYTITLNFLEETIAINQDVIIGETFDEIYMVGSATPGGWALSSQTPLTQNAQNEFEFSWSGELTAGEFKFKIYPEDDFCGGRWIHPQSQAQPLSETGFDLLVGCTSDNPDYKWVITDTDAGNYSILINMASRTISINQQ